MSQFFLALPMVVLLLSIAFMPLLAPRFWERRESLFLFLISGLSVIADFCLLEKASDLLIHSIFMDYIPFIIMLFTLYVISNGINIKVHATPTTLANIMFIATGGILSSFIGTTGSAMLLIKPFLSFNNNRKKKAHLLIFFIIVIANIGGLLTPLGDPPLLLGYLHGVDFSWPLINLFKYWFIYIAFCLIILYIIDSYYIKQESLGTIAKKVSIEISGYKNILLIIVTAFILFLPFYVYIKNILLLAITYIAAKGKKEAINYEPFKEVTRVFFCIFIVLAPVLFLLEENNNLIQNFIQKISHNPAYAYFTLCGAASSFLDNAPSYLLFVKMTGYPINTLMTDKSNLLIAISLSSVVMGSITYIGNAPNMMIKNIAKQNGIKMPSFMTYFVIALSIIIPSSWVIVKLFNFT